MTWKDGSSYDGTWFDNQPSGHGTYIKMKNPGKQFISKYEGKVANGKAEGKGTFTEEADGGQYVYAGDWKYNRQHGKGKETNPDGSEYEGMFSDGKKQGEGHMKWMDGTTTSEYKGEWVNDIMHGKGTYKWKGGEKEYAGAWLEGKMDGDGTMKWRDGRSYKGHFKNDLFHGRGKFVWPTDDGQNWYEGEFDKG